MAQLQTSQVFVFGSGGGLLWRWRWRWLWLWLWLASGWFFSVRPVDNMTGWSGTTQKSAQQGDSTEVCGYQLPLWVPLVWWRTDGGREIYLGLAVIVSEEPFQT